MRLPNYLSIILSKSTIMPQKIRFTADDDLILMGCLKRCDANVAEAARMAQSLLSTKRTLPSISSRYKKSIIFRELIPARKAFSQKDDDVIIKHIKNSPTNILNATALAAQELDRTATSVNQRYYGTLRKDPKVMAVTAGSSKGFTQNVKNLARDKDGNMPDQQLKGYMWLMREMLDLPKEDRDKIINFFK